MIVERVGAAGENDRKIRLACGHEIITTNPHVRAGNVFTCPECEPEVWQPPALRKNARAATPEQLDAIAEDYAETMRARGFNIDAIALQAIRRAAGIQDAWRVAFANVLGQ